MIDQRIEQALRSSEPVHELQNLVLHLFAEGQTREAILELFEGVFLGLAIGLSQILPGAVMDVMDFLVGWCSPHMKMPPEQPTSGGRG